MTPVHGLEFWTWRDVIGATVGIWGISRMGDVGPDGGGGLHLDQPGTNHEVLCQEPSCEKWPLAQRRGKQVWYRAAEGGGDEKRQAGMRLSSATPLSSQ